jgi:PTH1 family peptidyl-tRNA hydrolase
MKIIVGLGNPGRKYERTRHNVGFLALDALAQTFNVVIGQEKFQSLIGRARIHDHDAILAKPQTYMNNSGKPVAAILRETYTAITDLIVVHDELDLSLGSVRVKIGGGHGGHNGLRSLIGLLGSSDFIRVRIGVGRPAPGMDAADYVLSQFLTDERQALADAITRASEVITTIISEGPTRAMNVFNQK